MISLRITTTPFVCCLLFFDIRNLINLLVSSNCSYKTSRVIHFYFRYLCLQSSTYCFFRVTLQTSLWRHHSTFSWDIPNCSYTLFYIPFILWADSMKYLAFLLSKHIYNKGRSPFNCRLYDFFSLSIHSQISFHRKF